MIPLIKFTFYEENETKKQLIHFIQKAKYLSFGEECKQFEKNFAKWQKRKYCIFFNSGSSANLAIIQALMNLGKLKKGDEVGISALTWSTNTMPIIQLGLRAVPIDVELNTLNVSSRNLLAILKKIPLKMVILTNLFGLCDDIDEIKKICGERDIILVEDNCESLGTAYKGELLGNFGLASSFSFYVGHHMSTIEGGAVCTNSEQLATMLEIVRSYGWDKTMSEKSRVDIRSKHQVNSPFYSRYMFYDLGYNLRPTEINGFIGNIQIKYLETIIKKRYDNFFKLVLPIYKQTNKYYPIRYNHIDFISSFAIPVICKSQLIRDQLVEKCHGKVEIRPIMSGDITQQPFFLKYMEEFSGILGDSNAKLIYQQGLYFGNYPELTNEEIKTLINIFI